MQLAESTNDKLAIAVLKDIADEERVHVGEFLRLLRELAPDERSSMQGDKRGRKNDRGARSKGGLTTRAANGGSVVDIFPDHADYSSKPVEEPFHQIRIQQAWA